MKENFYSKKNNSTLRTLFEPFSLSLVKGPLSHHNDFNENYFYSQTRRDDEKKALLLFLSSLFLCVLVEVVSRFFIRCER